MEVDTSDNPRPADTMDEIFPTHIEEAERIDSFLVRASPLIPEGSPLEEGQISPHHSSLLPSTTTCGDEEVQALPFSELSFMERDEVLKSSVQNNAWINRGMDTPTASVIDPHSQESQKLNKGKAKSVDCGWTSGWGNNGWGTSSEVAVANHDPAPMNPSGNGKEKKGSDNWDSGWSSNNRVSSTGSHATLSPPIVSSSAPPATTTKETINPASANSLQETPQSNQSTTGEPANNGWGSWEANNGWGSPFPTGGAASEWSALPAPTGGNESWGPPAPRSLTAGEDVVTTMTTAPTSAWGGTGGRNLKTASRRNFEDKSEGSFGRGRGRGRGSGRGSGRGRDYGWSGLGGSGRRDDSSPSDQALAKSFNHSSTSLGDPGNGWGTRPRENNQSSETFTTRRYRQEQSTQPVWGLSIPPPPIHQAQPTIGSQVYQSPLSPVVAFHPPAPPSAMRSVLWPLHTDLTLKRDFSQHTSKIAKYQARLTELETKQRHVHGWYHSQANNLSQLHAADRETLEKELSKARFRRDDNLAALKVDEKKYAGLAEFEWMLLVRTLAEEMARTLESGVHELLWKMTAASEDGKRGIDINRALEEIVKTAMPSIIERPLQRYAESIVKATQEKYHKVEVAAPVEDHPMKEQSDTTQVSSSDLQEILGRLSALEQENADLKTSNIELQEAIQQLEVKTQEMVSSVRKEALGWTLEGNDHPVAQQIREKFQAERDFIIEGITSNLQLAFEAVLDRHSLDV